VAACNEKPSKNADNDARPASLGKSTGSWVADAASRDSRRRSIENAPCSSYPPGAPGSRRRRPSDAEVLPHQGQDPLFATEQLPTVKPKTVARVLVQQRSPARQSVEAAGVEVFYSP
jgi:hypothetical protein